MIRIKANLTRYADPAHEEGVTIKDLYKAEIPYFLKLMKRKPFKEFGVKIDIGSITITDLYPLLDPSEGGGDGDKERFHLDIELLITKEDIAKEDEAHWLRNWADVWDNMDDDLLEWAGSAGYEIFPDLGERNDPERF